MYNRKDHYYKKAKEEGHASRAVYKLEQIHSKYNVIKKGERVVDLGCAPGGWMEIVSELVGKNGIVVGIDILPIKIHIRPNMKFVLGDINDEKAMEQVASLLNLSITPSHHPTIALADVVISDMAPNTSGVQFKDAYLSYELCSKALEIAGDILKDGGNFVAKIFQGREADAFKKEMKKVFNGVEAYIPPATRISSKEFYLVGIGFNRKG